MGQFGYPLAQFHREAFWRGEIPLWNPLNDCGLPFLAQWNTLVLYPGSLIYLLFPLPWSLNLFVLAHLFLAAAGMYSLALRWTGNRFAASVAGLAFAWNGLTLHALMWPNNIAALGWMPWVVLVTERAWSEGGRRIVTAALIGAIQMLTGAPEILLLTWLIVGLLWLRDVLNGEASRVKILYRAFACAALIFALSAAQLFPFLELLKHSHRDTSFGGAAWSMPLWGWANFFVPLFGCTPSVVGVYSQDAQQWTSSYYMGIGVVAFSLLAFRARDTRVKWIAGIAIAGLVFSLGEGGYVYAGLKRILPVLGFIRFPIKYVVLVVFALPLLAAFGINAWQQNENDRLSNSLLVRMMIPVLLIIVLLSAFTLFRPIQGSPANVVLSSAASRALILISLAAALLFSRGGTPIKPRIALVLLLALMSGDIITHMPRQNPVVASRAYGPLQLDMSNIPKTGESRAMISPPMQQTLMGLAHPDPFTLFTGQRRMLISDCNLIDHVPKVNGFYSLYLREANEVTRRLYRTTNYHLPLLDFLSVTQISDDAELFAWHARSNAMPLMTGGQQPIFAPSAETLDAILAKQFDPRHTVYLPLEAQPPSDGIGSNNCRVISADVRREKISAQLEASGAAVVVVSQAHYDPWKAFVDGKPVPIWKANFAYQAVIMPSGAHRLELRYEDRWFRRGAIISALSWLLCGTAILVRRRR